MSLAQDAARAIADFFSFFPDWLIVVIVSMLPVAELRGSIPVGVLVLGMKWWAVYLLAVPANVIVAPIIWWLLGPVERVLRRLAFMDRFLTRLYDHTRRRSAKRVETYEELAIFLFVAIPLPGTGAWTGALIAYIFDLPRVKSFWVIAAGVATAGILVLVFVGGVGIFRGLFG